MENLQSSNFLNVVRDGMPEVSFVRDKDDIQDGDHEDDSSKGSDVEGMDDC